jgi:hypothetical protein
MLTAGSVVAMLSGCSVGSDVGDPTVLSTQPSSMVATTRPVAADSLRIELRFGDELATATLAPTPAAREFAAMLPLELYLHDPMGQAKSGQLPRPLDLTDIEPLSNPAVGQLYYWAPSHTFAIFYEDFGHSIPDPGLVRLGAVNSGIDRIADAGNDFTLRIDLVTPPDDTTRF